MKLTKAAEGKQITKPHWKGTGKFYRVKMFGSNIVVVENEFGQEELLNRDDMDNDWIVSGGNHAR